MAKYNSCSKNDFTIMHGRTIKIISSKQKNLYLVQSSYDLE